MVTDRELIVATLNVALEIMRHVTGKEPAIAVETEDGGVIRLGRSSNRFYLEDSQSQCDRPVECSHI